MSKIDPTTRFITDRRPDFVRTEVSPNDAPPNRVNVPRLGISGFTKPMPFSFEQLAWQALESALPNHAFFLDTCFVKKEVPQTCWDALLSKTIFITQWIDYELRHWRSDPKVNAGFHKRFEMARSVPDEHIIFLPNKMDDPDLARVTQHYVSLLLFRKDIFRILRERLILEKKVEPSDDTVHREVQKLVRERGMTIASKGKSDANKPNFTADEDLVVRAFLFALTTGRDVTVLTRDKDLSEQFYKLQYLIDTHYRSFLLAEAFVKQPLNFRRYDDPSSQIKLEGFDSIEIFKMPAGMDNRVLPESYDFVNIHINRITESGKDLFHTVLGFSAETKMAEMLRVKGRTNGLNTDSLAGKNLHRCIHPDLQDVLGSCFGIVNDRFVKNDDGRWSLTDIQLVIAPCERAGKLQKIEQPTLGVGKRTLAQACDIANFRLPQRLTPTHSLGWVSTHLEAMALAIEMLKPWTRILVDRELISDLPPRLLEALKSKDCCVLPTQSLPPSIAEISSLSANEGRKIVDYYTALLSHRKMFGRWCKESIERKFRETPSQNVVRKKLEEYCDPSCWLRSKDYFERPTDPNVFDDELLVVDAFFKAACNGRDTIILTSRPTLIDQFWTLAALIQRHYQAWAVARSDPDRFLQLKLNTKQPAPSFSSNLWKLDYSPARVLQSLPSSSVEIGVQAWCLRGNLEKQFFVYPVGFPVEPAMVEMFRTKEENELRNHDWKDERNVHLQYATNEQGQKVATCYVGVDLQVLIGSDDFPSDLRLPLSVSSVPAFDITLMTAMERRIPFPWALAEQGKVFRKNLKKRRSKLNNRSKR